MIFFDKTRTIGQDANGKNVVWVSVYVDTAANLPAYNDYQSDGFMLCMASEGRCIDTGDLYRLDSAGAWQISQAGTGTYTKAEIDTLLNAKQDVLTFDNTPTQNSTNPVTSGGVWTDQQRQDTLQAEDRAALVEIVDGGAKNLLKLGFTTKTVGTQTATMTADGNGIIVNGDRNTSSDVILVYDLSTDESAMSDTRYTLPIGRYVIAPTGTSMLRIQVYCHDGGGVNSERLGQASTDAVEFEYTSALKTQYPYIAFRLWASRVSSFDNFTIYPMICSKAEWDITNTYQPYRPSWQEMYERIVALENG